MSTDPVSVPYSAFQQACRDRDTAMADNVQLRRDYDAVQNECLMIKEDKARLEKRFVAIQAFATALITRIDSGVSLLVEAKRIAMEHGVQATAKPVETAAEVHTRNLETMSLEMAVEILAKTPTGPIDSAGAGMPDPLSSVLANHRPADRLPPVSWQN